MVYSDCNQGLGEVGRGSCLPKSPVQGAFGGRILIKNIYTPAIGYRKSGKKLK